MNSIPGGMWFLWECNNNLLFLITFFCFVFPLGKTYSGNKYGQLGVGDTISRSTPQSIKWVYGTIKSIHAGDCFSLILTEQDEIYVFGYNKYSQLGLGDKFAKEQKVLIPTKIESSVLRDKKITNISVGWYHVILSAQLNDKNEIIVWGANHYGQLGLEANKKDKKEAAAASSFSIGDIMRAIFLGQPKSAPLEDEVNQNNMSTEAVISVGEPTVLNVPEFEKGVDYLYAQSYVSFAKLSDGRIYAWGLNNLGTYIARSYLSLFVCSFYVN